MIEIMNDVPANVVAFRAIDKVTKADYESIVIPGIDKIVKEQDKINFMLVLDTKLSNFTIGAIMDDLGVGLKHFSK